MDLDGTGYLKQWVLLVRFFMSKYTLAPKLLIVGLNGLTQMLVASLPK